MQLKEVLKQVNLNENELKETFKKISELDEKTNSLSDKIEKILRSGKTKTQINSELTDLKAKMVDYFEQKMKLSNSAYFKSEQAIVKIDELIATVRRDLFNLRHHDFNLSNSANNQSLEKILSKSK